MHKKVEKKQKVKEERRSRKPNCPRSY